MTFELADAIVRQKQGLATAADTLLINEWLKADQHNAQLYEKIMKDEDQVLERLKRVDTESALVRLHQRSAKERRTQWIRVAVAAAILTVLGLFVIPRFIQFKSPENVPIASEESGAILPAGDRAILLTGDGKRLELRENGDTTFAYGNLEISQKDGTLSYELRESAPVVQQQLITPNAGKYSMVLPDGSQVWLNAASTLRFPNRFTGDERVVELDGEGYFEVAKDAAHPFIVKTNSNSEVRVLGTVFNVKGYGGDRVRTTLLEGSVRINSKGQEALLKPGEVAEVGTNGIRTGKGDIPAATAWRHDKFMFHNMPVAEMMEELSRWYDVKIVYGDGYSQKEDLYNGEIGRSVTLDKLLDMLEQTGIGHFTLKERTLYIKP